MSPSDFLALPDIRADNYLRQIQVSDDGDFRLVYSACGSFFVFQDNPQDLPGAWVPSSDVLTFDQVKACALLRPPSDPIHAALRSLSIFRPAFRARCGRNPV